MAQNNRKVTMTFDANTQALVSKIKTATENSSKSLNTVKGKVGETNAELAKMTSIHFPKLQKATEETSRKMGNMNLISQNGFTETKARLDKVVLGLSEMTKEARATTIVMAQMKASSDAFGTSLAQVTKSNTALLSKMTQQMDQFQKKMSSGGGRGNRGETGTALDLYINAAKLRLFAAAYKTITGILDETAGSAYRSQTTMLALSRITGESFDTISAKAIKLAKDTNTTSESIVELAQSMSGTGKTLAKDYDFFNVVLRRSVASSRSATEEFKDLNEITNAFGISGVKVAKILDFFNIKTEQDTRSVAKLAREAKEAGVSFQMLASIVGTLKQKGIGLGEQESEALKRVLDGAQNLEIPFQRVIDQLGQIAGNEDAIRALEKLLSLKPNDQGLRLMIQHLDIIKKGVKDVSNFTDELDKRTSVSANTLTGRINVLKESLKSLFVDGLSNSTKLMEGLESGVNNTTDESIAYIKTAVGAGLGFVAGAITTELASLLAITYGMVMSSPLGLLMIGGGLVAGAFYGSRSANTAGNSPAEIDAQDLRNNWGGDSKRRDEFNATLAEKRMIHKIEQDNARDLLDAQTKLNDGNHIREEMEGRILEITRQIALTSERRALADKGYQKFLPKRYESGLNKFPMTRDQFDSTQAMEFVHGLPSEKDKFFKSRKIGEAGAGSEADRVKAEIQSEIAWRKELSEKKRIYSKAEMVDGLNVKKVKEQEVDVELALSKMRQQDLEWRGNKSAASHKAEKTAIENYRLDLREIELQWRDNLITENERVKKIEEATTKVRQFNLTLEESREVTNTSRAAQTHITEEIEKQVKAADELLRKQIQLDIKYARSVRDHETNMRAIGKSGSVKEMMMFGRDKTIRSDTASDLFNKTGGMDLQSFAQAAKARNAALKGFLESGDGTTKEQSQATNEMRINSERLGQAYALNFQLMSMDEQLYAKKVELQDKYYMTENVLQQFYHDQAVNFTNTFIDNAFAGTLRLKDLAIESLKAIASQMLKMMASKGIARFFSGGLSDLGVAAFAGIGSDAGGLGSALSAGFTGSGINGVGRFANGSRMRGVGGDTIPAMLTPGEIVLDKSASDLFRQTMGRGNGQPIIVNVNSYPSLLGNREEMLRLDSGLNNPSIKSVRGRRG